MYMHAVEPFGARGITDQLIDARIHVYVTICKGLFWPPKRDFPRLSTIVIYLNTRHHEKPYSKAIVRVMVNVLGDYNNPAI
jgi:hypothetical protein